MCDYVYRVQLSPLAHQGEVADSAFSNVPRTHIDLYCIVLKKSVQHDQRLEDALIGIPHCLPKGKIQPAQRHVMQSMQIVSCSEMCSDETVIFQTLVKIISVLDTEWNGMIS
jgi:hypothetical protein